MSDPIVRWLVETSMRVSLVAGAIALILASLRVRSSAARHAAWTPVLGAMLLMLVLPYSVADFAISIPLLPLSSPAVFAPRVASRAAPGPTPRMVEHPGSAPVFAPPSARVPGETSTAQERW